MQADQLIADATVALAIATFFVAFIAVFQDHIRALIWKPKVAVETTGKPPDCHMLQVIQRSPKGNEPVDCCYLRLRVANRGRVTAQAVEVYIAQVSERRSDGSYQRLEDRPSMALVWSYSDDRDSVLPNLHPGVELYCDLGHIVKPTQRYPAPYDPTRTELELDVRWRSTSLNYFLDPGRYRLLIQVAAANMQPVTETLDVDLAGPWYNAGDDMLSKGIEIAFL